MSTLPGILYWPSSPSSGDDFHRSQQPIIAAICIIGASGTYNEPIRHYRSYFPRFMSEFGIQSFLELKTDPHVCPRKGLQYFLLHHGTASEEQHRQR
ncbi:MAG: hypothetical protein MZU97_19970 [Bacillus subtilis]|nr:hypothetical protein [Bacillus subtilis]